MRTTTIGLLTMLLSAGCYSGLSDHQPPGADGDGGDASGGGDDGDDGMDDGAPPPEEANEVALSGLRRLTAAEYDATIRDLLLDDASDSQLLLPVDPRTPFDNDYTAQIPSETLVEAAELLATDAADRLLDDTARIDMLLPCTPTGPDDEDCMEQFAQQWGRRALRRTPLPEELQLWLHGENGDDGAVEIAVEEGDFNWGVHTIVRLLLQDPEFLYRVEIGTPVEGDPSLYRLNDFEIATRLSYFLWGSTPDDWMLDRAEEGGISAPEDVRAVADMMLEDPRALERLDRFHAMWFGYESMPFGGQLMLDMREESRRLLERVAFTEDAPWQDMFRAAETFVTEELAEHYGLPAPADASGDWVSYGESGRQGLFSHGSFLSVGGKFGDTSPVQRGLAIRTRVFCQVIPPPPPGVDADEEPGDGDAICKEDRYRVHSTDAGCAACHALIDPVGFGLENYGPTGQFRSFEPDDPDTPDDESQCEITGEGELEGIGEFSGPAELADLALAQRYLDRCVQQQMTRFMNGRYEFDDFDQNYLSSLGDTFDGSDFTLRALILEMTGSDTFGYRRDESAQ